MFRVKKMSRYKNDIELHNMYMYTIKLETLIIIHSNFGRFSAIQCENTESTLIEKYFTIDAKKHDSI
jgi:hypothetical protein